MENREDKIVGEIDDLIKNLRKSTDETMREQIQGYARRVFSMGPGRPIHDSTA